MKNIADMYRDKNDYNFKKARGKMKQEDIKKCALCEKGMMHGGIPLFYTIKIQAHTFEMEAIQRQHGLEQFFGKAAQLASIMGPNEDLTKEASEEVSIWVCQECSVMKLLDLMNSVELPIKESRIKKLGE